MKVVIVDDSALVRRRLAAMISGLTGIELAGDAFDVDIVDYH